MTKNYVECICTDNTHTFRISWHKDDPDKIYIHTQLTKLSWPRRLINGILYILGRESKYGHWEETILDKAATKKLVKLITKKK